MFWEKSAALLMVWRAYEKWRRTGTATRRDIDPFYREATSNGMIPLGYRRVDGRHEYVWLIFDGEAATETQRQTHARERTPPGCAPVILRL